MKQAKLTLSTQLISPIFVLKLCSVPKIYTTVGSDKHGGSRAVLMQCLVARPWCLTFAGSSYVSGKLPTYPSPKPTLTLTSYLGQNVGLGEG